MTISLTEAEKGIKIRGVKKINPQDITVLKTQKIVEDPTTNPPYLPKSIPRSTTKLEVEDLKILAYPSGRLVEKCKSREELETRFLQLAEYLEFFRIDLLRPYGSCPKCGRANLLKDLCSVC